VAQVDRGDAVLLGQAIQDVVLADEPESDQVFTQSPAALGLFVEGVLQLGFADQLRLGQEFSEFQSHASTIRSVCQIHARL
jgi:hypothetical protein